MAIRLKHRLFFAACVVAILGVVGGWWAANPVGPELALELAIHTTPQNLVPRGVLAGPPPAGTRWETYSVHLPYSQVIRAMKLEPGWTVGDGKDFLGVPKTTFTATRAGQYRQVEIRPGRLIVIDPALLGPAFIRSGGGFTVVATAVSTDTTPMKSMQGLLDRFLGRKPAPAALGKSVLFVRDPEYKPSVLPPASRPRPSKTAP